MSISRRPDRIHWQSALLVLAFLFASAPLVSSQSISQSSAEKRDALKQAVVIVTTVDLEGKPLRQGSGFFLTADRVVTNLHVIKDASVISIETFDGTTSTVPNVVAVSEADDLALLQLESPMTNVAVLQLADSAPIEGDAIMVMSSPRGSRWKLTQGEVGPLWTFKGTGKRIQITASILPGSSGGPVVNTEGRVVGIAAMHFESTDELNFAVPAHRLKALQSSTSIASIRSSISGH